jgi:putative endonuclease
LLFVLTPERPGHPQEALVAWLSTFASLESAGARRATKVGRGGGGVLAKDALGKYGEDLAARHFVGAGFTVLARNWRCPVGEIDIVARDGDVLVIAEVKTRRSTAYGTPAEAITRRKLDKLRELALMWLRENPGAASVRFDVVSVLLPKAGSAQLEHLRGVL